MTGQRRLSYGSGRRDDGGSSVARERDRGSEAYGREIGSYGRRDYSYEDRNGRNMKMQEVISAPDDMTKGDQRDSSYKDINGRTYEDAGRDRRGADDWTRGDNRRGVEDWAKGDHRDYSYDDINGRNYDGASRDRRGADDTTRGDNRRGADDTTRGYQRDYGGRGDHVDMITRNSRRLALP